jgi:hypothetical protein
VTLGQSRAYREERRSIKCERDADPPHPGAQIGSPYVIMHDEELGEIDEAVVG